MTNGLPEGHRERPARIEDGPAIHDLLDRRALEVIGVSDMDADEVASMLTDPTRDISREVLVVEDPQGALVAWIDVHDEATNEYQMVIHELASGHVGGALHRHVVERAEALAREVDGARGRPISLATWADDPPTTRVLEDAGFVQIRRFPRMHRTFAGPLERPVWPEGVELREVDPAADLAAIHDVLVEAFADHEGGGFPDLERFRHATETAAGYDPTLWAVAWSGDTVAGAAVVRGEFSELPGHGYVADLGVRRAARGRGLGRALLLEAFRRLEAAGRVGCGLHVDEDSLTGATRLYAGVGMTATPRYAHFRRPPGRPAPPGRLAAGAPRGDDPRP